MKKKLLLTWLLFCCLFFFSATVFAGGEYGYTKEDTVPVKAKEAPADATALKAAQAAKESLAKKAAKAKKLAKAQKKASAKLAADAKAFMQAKAAKAKADAKEAAKAKASATKADTTKAMDSATQKTLAAKAGLVKKFLSFISFKKKAEEKRKQETLATVTALNFPDSMKNIALQLRAIIDTVSNTQDSNYIKLTDDINTLYLLMKRQDSIAAVPYQLLLKKEPGLSADPAANPALRIIPLAQMNTENGPDNNPDKYRALAVIRQVADKQFHSSTYIDSASGKTWKLAKKADICAYYNANMNLDYSHTDFHFISTLIYDSLFTVISSGQLHKLKSWMNNGLIDSAKNAGCRIIYTLSLGSGVRTDELLSDIDVKEKFAAAIEDLKRNNRADGININFGDLSSYDRDFFTQFVSYVSQLCSRFSLIIYITVPVYDEQNAYDIKSLEPFTERFCIDFSARRPSQPAPLAPLSGKERTTMESSLSYYLNQKMNPGKFMINISNRGTKWLIYLNGKKSMPGRFIQYITYAAIRNKTYATVLYDSLSYSAFIDTVYEGGRLITRIWFDDENTLGDKYDFVLQNGLGGIGFGYLGYDGTYGELWNELLYKFIRVDSIAPSPVVMRSLNFFQKLYRRYILYDYILDNPCQCIFDSAQNAGTLNQYIADLGIDTISGNQNAELAKADTIKAKQKTPFMVLTKQLNETFLGISLFFLLLLVVFAAVYVYYTREQGDKWKYKKGIGWALIVLAVLFAWSLFDFLFTASGIHGFGVIVNYSGEDSQTDKSDCINMPLATLLEIIVTASLIGLLLTRYLLMPLLKREDIP